MQDTTDNPVIQLVLFRLAGQEFAADISSILEITRMVEITTIPKASDLIEGVVNLRGQITAVINLARFFDLEVSDQANVQDKRMIVVRLESETIAFIVDEVLGLIKLNADSIEAAPELAQTQKIRKDYIRGVGRQDDRLIIILDLKAILSAQECENLEALTSQHQ